MFKEYRVGRYALRDAPFPCIGLNMRFCIASSIFEIKTKIFDIKRSLERNQFSKIPNGIRVKIFAANRVPIKALKTKIILLLLLILQLFYNR